MSIKGLFDYELLLANYRLEGAFGDKNFNQKDDVRSVKTKL